MSKYFMIFLRFMLRDETIYPEPDRFSPERFMENVDPEMLSKRDPRNYIFGLGRK